MTRISAILAALLLPTYVSGAAPDKTVPAINEIEAWQQVGQQPYEFTWTQREENPHTLVDFEDVKGWTLELYNGASGEFRRSREQQMWGQCVGKFLYAGTGAESRIVARPPEPIPISGKFDSVEMWGYGNRWGYARGRGTSPVDVSILITDAAGREFPIQLTDIRWRQWWLIHRRILPDTLRQIVLPASFSGIQISKLANRQPLCFYCDSLAFYTEELPALTFQPQPKRNLKPFRGQIAGLNTGPGTLPFPTREETILPENREQEFRVTVREPQRGRFEFAYHGSDAAIVYDYRPRAGLLSELTVRVNGGAAFRPLDGGGVQFTDTPASQAAAGRLLSAALDGEVVRAKFAVGSRIVDYEMRLWQKSLVLDVWCDGGEATELVFGRVTGVTSPKLIVVPYLTYGATNPRVLISGGAAAPVFTSVWFDWYRTNASEPFSAREPKVTADSAEINGGLRYIARTDGRRNNLHERVFLTNSPVYEEVLPTIANPPSLRQEEGKQVVWTVTAPDSFVKDHERCRVIRSYGLDKIMQHSHEVTWRDDGDSFTLRLKAAPQKGGDAMLQWYIKAQTALGWTQGVYTNYTDFASVNSNWNPDWVQRQPDGEWRRAWYRCYALKPAKAVEFDEYYAGRIKEKFDNRMSYTDVHTAVAPWRYCDFDARVPGAGTMAATFYAYGQLLRHDQMVYGPANSEATYQWMYAGLESGSYGWIYTDVNLLTAPVDPAFQLTKIHPLEADYGMGYTYYYLEKLDPKWVESPKRRELVDLFLATTIAYGNMGWLVKEFEQHQPFGTEALARSYYMMQQLQQQYAFVKPRRIEYAGPDGQLMSASQAHATGAIADSRLHVIYENGTEVFVNRSSSGPWTVKDAAAHTVELPVSGWLVFNSGTGFYEASANVGGRRVDYVASPEFEFLDGRGQWTERGNLGCSGSVALRQKGGVLELIDIYGNDRISFQAKRGGVLIAYDPNGKDLGKVDIRSPRTGWYEFRPAPGARRYVFASAQ